MIKLIKNWIFKPEPLDTKFKKGDRVAIQTREYDGLKDRTATVKQIRGRCDDGTYNYIIDIDLLPHNYQLKTAPRIFNECELEFIITRRIISETPAFDY